MKTLRGFDSTFSSPSRYHWSGMREKTGKKKARLSLGAEDKLWHRRKRDILFLFLWLFVSCAKKNKKSWFACQKIPFFTCLFVLLDVCLWWCSV